MPVVWEPEFWIAYWELDDIINGRRRGYHYSRQAEGLPGWPTHNGVERMWRAMRQSLY